MAGRVARRCVKDRDSLLFSGMAQTGHPGGSARGVCVFRNIFSLNKHAQRILM